MPRIFISYRRDDSWAVARSLCESLDSKFGESNVFRDISSIEPGRDFLADIRECLGKSDVCLVLIGSRWLMAKAGQERPRIESADDPVRIEIEVALSKQRLLMIPVLIGDAELPDPVKLPESIRPLLKRNAARLTDASWEFDVGKLMDTIAAADADRRRPWRPTVARALGVLTCLLIVWVSKRALFPLVPVTALPGLYPWTFGIGLGLVIAPFAIYYSRRRWRREAFGSPGIFQRWSERQEAIIVLLALSGLLGVIGWMVPAGVTIRPVRDAVSDADCRSFARRTNYDEKLEHQVKVVQPSTCEAFKDDRPKYEVRVFTGLVPVANLAILITIAGMPDDSVIWANVLLKQSEDDGWHLELPRGSRQIAVRAPERVQGAVSILATYQYGLPNPESIEISATTSVAGLERLWPSSVQQR